MRCGTKRNWQNISITHYKKVFAKEYGGVDLNCIAIFFNQEDKKYEGWYFLANGNNKKHSITTDYKNLKLNNHEDKKQYNGKTL